MTGGRWTAAMLAAASAVWATVPAAAQDRSEAPDQRGIATVRAAIASLQNGGGADASRPVPIGNAGQWFGPAAYPPAAMRAGAQGRVVAEIGVDDRGRVTDCVVTSSSGSSDLDAATCAIARRSMTFTPAHAAGGRAIAGHYTLPVRWQLPAGSTQPQGVATVLVSVGPDGAVLSCAGVSPSPLGDMCLAFPVGRKLDVPPAMRGKVYAVGTMVRPLAE